MDNGKKVGSDSELGGSQETTENDTKAASTSTATAFDKAAEALRMLLDQLEGKALERLSDAAESSSQAVAGASKAVVPKPSVGKTKKKK